MREYITNNVAALPDCCESHTPADSRFEMQFATQMFIWLERIYNSSVKCDTRSDSEMSDSKEASCEHMKEMKVFMKVLLIRRTFESWIRCSFFFPLCIGGVKKITISLAGNVEFRWCLLSLKDFRQSTRWSFFFIFFKDCSISFNASRHQTSNLGDDLANFFIWKHSTVFEVLVICFKDGVV